MDEKKACFAGDETLERVKIVDNNAYVTLFSENGYGIAENAKLEGHATVYD